MHPYILYYLFVINLLAILVTAYDKTASKYFTRNRVRESVLLLISALGGSIIMYVTMKLIRHKTKNKKFILGIPMIIIFQILVGIFLITQKVL
ncbi:MULTISPECIES: DUF1294 domain-containing protein [Helcococcus]|uniref:DUF1294 domain-containing protein n=1 Tax=Helcococcus bovis TaxID=3153252 RepID=A0ABW9F6I3_9FIRM